MSYTIPMILTFISIIILIAAIKNAYQIRREIQSVKDKRNLNFIKSNILISIIFLVNYFIYIGLLFFDRVSAANFLTAVTFILIAIFVLIVSIVTREMGALLYKIDNIRKLDPLTKVFNRAQIEKLITKEFDRCRRHNRQSSLMMIDINQFKFINDNYGHQAGDKVILDLVDTVRNISRSEDIFGRFGGDEFILILPEANINAAQHFADRLIKEVANKKLEFSNKTFGYTISIGVSAVNFEYSSYDKWLAITDNDLYKSKLKNRESSWMRL
ncbi:MAG: GGDEF domain-containing protein [Gammaproteobacteria bacterium]|nr:GGDEF domain-containing protein [Gammaproteobacteria bacterium]